MSGSLLEAFVAAAAPELAERARRATALGPALLRMVEQAHAANEGLNLDDAAFAAFVAERLPADTELPAGLEGLAVGDLYLAHGCQQGDSLALEIFAMRYQVDVERAADKCRSAGISGPEFSSIVQERLFVAPAKIQAYRGRGDLRGWLRVVLSHLVVDLLRRTAARPDRHAIDPQDLARLADADDLELGIVQEHYREPLRAALEYAFSELSPRERNLLRLRLLDNWGYDQLGARYGVHRTSVARWLAAAQQRLLDGTWRRLHEQIGIARDEFTSVARLVRSRIHLSVRRILSTTLESEPDAGSGSDP